ncbi:Mucolipin-2 [Dermatophagoides farinae]|uniref:Mucolipin-2 n=1 Tax=Dermatophagoides farinae TaxID=6954 RepID=A0A922HKR4_DERFA|nr:Mucolipin-2 [Dermatophagoides farinae]
MKSKNALCKLCKNNPALRCCFALRSIFLERNPALSGVLLYICIISLYICSITGCACSCLFLLSPISTENVGERERARFSAENSENHKGDSPIVSVKKMNSCSLFLGIGNLLVWFPLLRYFAYFQSYNILLL